MCLFNSQTLTASPPFHQDFSLLLKTTSDHISSVKPTKLITSPTSASSSTDTPQSFQIQFQPPSNIPLPLLSSITSPCISKFPSSPTPTTHSLYSAPPSTSCHHLVFHPPSKVLRATPDSSLQVVQQEVQISPAVPEVASELMHLNLLAKTTTKLLLVCILFLLFLYNFEFLLGLLYFPREVFDIMYEDLLYGFYSLPFKFSGKVLPVILILLFFSFILYMPTRLFLSGANKKSFKSKNSVGRKCCQLKVLKVLLMHLFVTLLINKTTGSDNRHFFFNTLKNENKEEFLTYSTFCTLEQIEKNILRKRLSQDALSKVHLNKYGSYFKFILLLSGDINLNPGPTAPKRNDILWELLPFHNCSFSTEPIDYQLDTLSVVSNDAWNIFQKRGMYFIHLNINIILPKIDERRHIAKLTNATAIGLSGTKLDNAVLSSELEIAA